MWVFGYGSLIWKVDFPYEKKLVGHIKGYVRRFYQKSTDHRGTPSKPGRVVTLLESTNPEDQVWGVAYKIAPKDIDNVVNHLDFREKGGYTRMTVPFFPCDTRGPEADSPEELITGDRNLKINSGVAQPTSEEMAFHLTIYIGSENNPNYAGNESIETIAKHIIEAQGPSGLNTEYLYKLAAAMRAVAPGINDEHLFSLEEATRRLELERNNVASSMDEERT